MNFEERIYSTGLLYPVALGQQIDFNAAHRQVEDGWVEASFCNEDCTAEHGEYDCPAAISHNKGIRRDTMPAPEQIVDWSRKASKGQRWFRDWFLQERFDTHCERFSIPDHIRPIYRNALSSNKEERNAFGGNPELNPGLFKAVGEMLADGNIVNITTTGGETRKPEFVADLIKNRPHRLAVSADDLPPALLYELLELDCDQLAMRRNKTPGGQARKAIDGLRVGKLAERTEGFPPVLFNSVIKPSNVHCAIEMIEAMERKMPHTVVNPYPVQTSMHHLEPMLKVEHLEDFYMLLLYVIDRTLNDARFVKRLHYWLMLKAAYIVWKERPELIVRSLAGYDTWRCYQSNAAWYLQIGRYERYNLLPIHGLYKLAPKQPPATIPGGHPGCFWNAQTVTDSRQVEGPAHIEWFLRDGMNELSMSSPNPCPGCVMPRLVFHEVSLTSGMNPALVPEYLNQRMHYVGF